MLTLKTNAFSYKDANGNMTDVGAVVGERTTDTSLTQVGVAADAKAVGDRFSQFSEEKADQNGWTPNMVIGTDANGNMVARATYTEAEKQALIEEIIDSIKVENPDVHIIHGNIDENNVVTLFGDLPKGTYTFKFEDESGKTTEIGTKTIGEPIIITENIKLTWEIGLKLGKNDNNHTTVTVTPGVENANAYSASQVISYDENATYTLGMNEAYDMIVNVCCYDASGNNIGYLEKVCGQGSGSAAVLESVINAPVGTKSIRLRYWYWFTGKDQSALNWYHDVIWLKKTYME